MGAGRISERMVLGILLSLVAAVGCGTAPPRGHVAKEWALTMRELGIVPVFPPREDVQVGDVYARRCNPDNPALIEKRGFVPIDMWAASLDVRRVVSSFYEERMSFVDTAEAKAGETAKEASPLVRIPRLDGADANTFATVDRSRLRQVAFPDFASMSIAGGDLSAFVPIQALTAALGVHWQDTHRVDVKIPVAESYGVPADRLGIRVLATSPSGPGQSALVFDVEFLRGFRVGRDAWAATEPDLSEAERAAIMAEPYLYFDVITEVFYARTIELAITTTSDFGARLNVKPTPLPGSEGAAPEPADPGEPAPAQPAGATEGGDQRDAFDRAKDLNDRLAKVDSLSSVGGSFQFIAVSDTNVSMRRTYQRPIAVGFRSVQIAVDPSTGAVIGYSSGNSARPTAGSGEQIVTRAAEALEKVLRRSHPEARVRALGTSLFDPQFTVTGIPEAEAKASAALGADAVQVYETEGELSADERAYLDRLRGGGFTLKPSTRDP